MNIFMHLDYTRTHKHTQRHIHIQATSKSPLLKLPSCYQLLSIQGILGIYFYGHLSYS